MAWGAEVGVVLFVYSQKCLVLWICSIILVSTSSPGKTILPLSFYCTGRLAKTRPKKDNSRPHARSAVPAGVWVR